MVRVSIIMYLLPNLECGLFLPSFTQRRYSRIVSEDSTLEEKATHPSIWFPTGDSYGNKGLPVYSEFIIALCTQCNGIGLPLIADRFNCDHWINHLRYLNLRCSFWEPIPGALRLESTLRLPYFSLYNMVG
jgi:hypothetical protein